MTIYSLLKNPQHTNISWYISEELAKQTANLDTKQVKPLVWNKQYYEHPSWPKGSFWLEAKDQDGNIYWIDTMTVHDQPLPTLANNYR